MWRNVWKFLAAAAGIVVLGVLVLLAVQYVRYKNSPEYKTLVDLKNLEKQYAEDPYGGETPEETLRLFIDALKNGDTDLAAKYFVLDKQEEWREDLGKIKEKGLLDEMVKDLEKLKAEKVENETASYYFVGDDGIASPLVLIRASNKKWKIRTL